MHPVDMLDVIFGLQLGLVLYCMPEVRHMIYGSRLPPPERDPRESIEESRLVQVYQALANFPKVGISLVVTTTLVAALGGERLSRMVNGVPEQIHTLSIGAAWLTFGLIAAFAVQIHLTPYLASLLCRCDLNDLSDCLSYDSRIDVARVRPYDACVFGLGLSLYLCILLQFYAVVTPTTFHFGYPWKAHHVRDHARILSILHFPLNGTYEVDGVAVSRSCKTYQVRYEGLAPDWMSDSFANEGSPGAVTQAVRDLARISGVEITSLKPIQRASLL